MRAMGISVDTRRDGVVVLVVVVAVVVVVVVVVVVGAMGIM